MLETVIMIADLALYGITFLLAAACITASFCRIAAIEMQGVQYRHVAPIVLMFIGSFGVAVSMVGGDKTTWYQPVVLLAFAISLWNSKNDWADGMPERFRRRARIVQSPVPARTRQRIVYENAIIGTCVVAAVGVAGVGSAAGRGNPLQIYSAVASQPVVFDGDKLTVRYTYRRLRVCPGYASRFVIDLDHGGEVVQRFDQMPIGGDPVGRKMIDVPRVVPLQPGLAPGRYAYHVVLYSNCADGNYTQITPDVPFMVAVRPIAAAH